VSDQHSSSEHESPEKAREIDIQEKVEEFMSGLSYSDKKLLEDCKWEDTNKDWIDGFVKYAKEKLQGGGSFGLAAFKSYAKSLKKHYEETSYSSESEQKKLYKLQLGVAEKILGLHTGENSAEEKKKKSKEEMKSMWGWEHIKFTIANIRRQIFGIMGLRDPWWSQEHEQKRIEIFEQPTAQQKTPTAKAASAREPADVPKETANDADSEIENPVTGGDNGVIHAEMPANTVANDNHGEVPAASSEEKKAA